MPNTHRLFVTAVVAIALCGQSHAGRPFGLFASCESDCDWAACDESPCDRVCSNSDLESFGCDSRPDRSCCGPARRSGDGNACCCGRYCSIFGGWNLLDDYNGEQAAPPTLRGTFSDGWAIGGAIGRRINRAIRAELELTFRSNTGDQWMVGGAAGNWSGHVFSYSGMANVYHDFDRFNVAGIRPYVGAGIGLAIVDGDLETAATSIDIDGAAFAYQFIVGGSKSLNRSVDLFAEYRYFGTSNLDVVNAGTGALIDRDNPAVDNILFGLRVMR